MIGFISKMFGGSKSEKDVKTILPLVSSINQNFQSYQSLSNDELRNKTIEFRQRISQHLRDIEAQIVETNKRADGLPYDDLVGKDSVYQEVDRLKKERDQRIELPGLGHPLQRERNFERARYAHHRTLGIELLGLRARTLKQLRADFLVETAGDDAQSHGLYRRM